MKRKTPRSRDAIDNEKAVRIKAELAALGFIDQHGNRFPNHYLPGVMHDDEHIRAAVFGRRKETEGLFGFVEVILVATNRRILILEHQPGFTTTDEIAYDTVLGVNLSSTLLHATVVMYTKITNYSVSYASLESAQKFADYIERRAIEHKDVNHIPEYTNSAQQPTELTDFLSLHNICVFSFIQRLGKVKALVVFYTLQNESLYLCFEDSTTNSLNSLSTKDAVFTVFDTTTSLAAQMRGVVKEIHDNASIKKSLTALKNFRGYNSRNDLAHSIKAFKVYKFVAKEHEFFNYNDLSS